jgi:hypothetical protein
MWTIRDISIDFDPTQTDGQIVTAIIGTPVGRLVVMAEVEEVGRRLTLRRLHVHGADVRANDLGWAHLRRIAQLTLDLLEDYDDLIIEGAARTTGANPGHRPRILRFTRSLPNRI